MIADRIESSVPAELNKLERLAIVKRRGDPLGSEKVIGRRLIFNAPLDGKQKEIIKKTESPIDLIFV
jgi:hypothetical protein